MTSYASYALPTGFVALPIDLEGLPIKADASPESAIADWWKLCTEKSANKNGWYVAKCVICGDTATQIDDQFPYGTDYNRCDQHKRYTHCPVCSGNRCYIEMAKGRLQGARKGPHWRCHDCMLLWGEMDEALRLSNLHRYRKVPYTCLLNRKSRSSARSAESGSLPSSPTDDSPTSATSPPAGPPITREGKKQ